MKHPTKTSINNAGLPLKFEEIKAKKLQIFDFLRKFIQNILILKRKKLYIFRNKFLKKKFQIIPN